MANRIRLLIAVAIILGVATIGLFLSMANKGEKLEHKDRYGIYSLELSTGKATLIYGTEKFMQTSALRLNSAGNALIFAQAVGGSDDKNVEIYSIGVDGSNLRRLTDNSYFDLYPAWSPDGDQIAFLSWRGENLDLYLMKADGSEQHRLFDSGSHDADVDWSDNTIVFTAGFSIWSIKDDGTSPRQVTKPSNAGLWGLANLPIGDYDPRLSPDGKRIVFERLEDPGVLNGGYNFFLVNVDGTNEVRLTDTGYAQGLAAWSLKGDRIAYVVSAIDGAGKYDIYLMNSDGTNQRNVTPSYFPDDFLCYSPVFSEDDQKLFFIGYWFERSPP